LIEKGKPAVMQGHKITGPALPALTKVLGSRIAKIIEVGSPVFY
jgi:hypothetical protein